MGGGAALGHLVPTHKGFAYLSWQPVSALTIVPSLEFSSNLTSVTPASATGFAPVYSRIGAHADVGLRADYDLTQQVSIGIGVRNLFDAYYQLTDGFPEPGRSCFATIRARY